MKKNIRFNSNFLGTRWIQLGIPLCVALIFSFLIIQKASMQTQPDDDWTQPVNITNSGSASDPIVLVDSQNITHVIWYDLFGDYRHSEVGEDGIWSDPKRVNVPFSGIQPRLIHETNNYIYAFWLNQGRILYSKVKSESVGVSLAWGTPQALAFDALAFDVSIDEDQAVHLAYLIQRDSNSQSAGIYYMQKPYGSGWTNSQVVYISEYFRTIPPEQAHLSVAAGNLKSGSDEEESEVVEKKIFVAWDEPFMFRSMISSSTDGSNNWTVPVEVNPQSLATESAMPIDPNLIIWNNQVLLVWKKKLSETTCEILYKVAESGQDWSTANDNFYSLSGCPENSGFLAKRDDLVLWHAVIGNQVFLTVWDGSHWSEPRTEIGLTGFRDPESGKTLALGNRNLFYHADTNNLLAVGSDINGNQDVWFTSKPLNAMECWFLPYSSWKPIKEVSLAPFGLNDLNITTDEQGNFHTLWLQVPLSDADNQPTIRNLKSVVHYSQWDGTNWSDPSVVINRGEESIIQISAINSQSGDLMAIWRNETGCQISFTRVPGNRAFNNFEWMDPVALPVPGGTCSSPTLVAGEAEVVYAAYAVTVNEGRGIYLNRSIDGGRTWEEPIQVIDAQAAGWEMVDQPVIEIDGNRLHILWLYGSPLKPDVGQGLGYSYSDDGGITWSKADTSIDEPLRWAGLTSSTKEGLIRIWQQDSYDQPILSTQFSLDGGQSWTPASSISSFGETLGKPKLIADPDGGIHLLQAKCDYLEKVTLHHWSWDDGNWIAKESLLLGYGRNENNFDISGVISNQEQLAVIYTAGNTENGAQSLSAVISQTEINNRSSIESQENQEVISSPNDESIYLTEVAPQALSAIPTTIPTVTTTFMNIDETGNNQSPANKWIGLILGSILTLVVVAGVFWLRIWKTRI